MLRVCRSFAVLAFAAVSVAVLTLPARSMTSSGGGGGGDEIGQWESQVQMLKSLIGTNHGMLSQSANDIQQYLVGHTQVELGKGITRGKAGKAQSSLTDIGSQLLDLGKKVAGKAKTVVSQLKTAMQNQDQSQITKLKGEYDRLKNLQQEVMKAISDTRQNLGQAIGQVDQINGKLQPTNAPKSAAAKSASPDSEGSQAAQMAQQMMQQLASAAGKGGGDQGKSTPQPAKGAVGIRPGVGTQNMQADNAAAASSQTGPASGNDSSGVRLGGQSNNGNQDGAPLPLAKS